MINEKFITQFAGVLKSKIQQVSISDYECSWFDNQMAPCNANMKKYRGMNALFLALLCLLNEWKMPIFLTYNMAKKEGLNIRKGEKSSPIFYNGLLYINKETKKRIDREEYFPYLLKKGKIAKQSF